MAKKKSSKENSSESKGKEKSKGKSKKAGKKPTTGKESNKKQLSKVPFKLPETDKELGTNKVNTLELKTEKEVAMDFAIKVYKQFDKSIKAVVLFGSQAKSNSKAGSDIDIIIIVDDASIRWDQEMVAWYREELNKIIKANRYKKDLHINTVKLTTWWDDITRGDPTAVNIIRYGEPMVDLAGFFTPLKYLLVNGKIRSTPETIYSCLQRAPQHITRSKNAQLGSVEGLHWSMVDSSQAALIAKGASPPSPEHIPRDLKKFLVDEGHLKSKYLNWFKELLGIHKNISHGKISEIEGVEIDKWQERAQEFFSEMTKIVDELTKEKK